MSLFTDKIAWFSSEVPRAAITAWGEAGGAIQRKIDQKKGKGPSFYFSSNAEDEQVQQLMAGDPPVLVFTPQFVLDCVKNGALVNAGAYILPPTTFATTGIEVAAPVSAEKPVEEKRKREEEEKEDMRAGFVAFEPASEEDADAGMLELVTPGQGGWQLSAVEEPKPRGRRKRIADPVPEEDEPEPEEAEEEEEEPQAVPAASPRRERIVEDVSDDEPEPARAHVPGVVTDNDLAAATYSLCGDVGMAVAFVSGQVEWDDVAELWWSNEQDAVLLATVKGALGPHQTKLPGGKLQVALCGRQGADPKKNGQAVWAKLSRRLERPVAVCKKRMIFLELC